MGGRGGSSGKSGGGGGGSSDGIKGVEYKRTEYPRSPGHGELIPQASEKGIQLMKADLIKAGSKTGITSATNDQISKLTAQLNQKTPDARATHLNKMAQHYLELRGKAINSDSIERQLNKWKMSGVMRTYHPK